MHIKTPIRTMRIFYLFEKKILVHSGKKVRVLGFSTQKFEFFLTHKLLEVTISQKLRITQKKIMQKMSVRSITNYYKLQIWLLLKKVECLAYSASFMPRWSILKGGEGVCKFVVGKQPPLDIMLVIVPIIILLNIDIKYINVLGLK